MRLYVSAHNEINLIIYTIPRNDAGPPGNLKADEEGRPARSLFCCVFFFGVCVCFPLFVSV